MIKYSARSLALEILTKVSTEGAYANILLQKTLSNLSDKRDRYLTTALVNGTLKHRLTLDYALRKFLNKPLSSLPHEVRGILRCGAFQILFMEKIPVAAAVNEAVELTKKIAPKYSSLVNVVLRQTAKQGWRIDWPDPLREPVRYLSVRFSHPEWMVRRWYKRWGLEETATLCRLNNEPATTWVRTNRLRTDREHLINILQEDGVIAVAGQRVPESLMIREYDDLTKLRAFQQGLFTVQDESSQLAAYVLNPQAGQKVLDTCAAPGGKTTHIAELMQNRGDILACDIHLHKLSLIRDLAQRLGISIIRTEGKDAQELPESLFGSMNRVLVDAPCSGLGVLRRKADIRWQRTEKEIEGFPALQLAILERAAACVVPGGELLYSTCTIEPEENFEVVKAFRKRQPQFAPVDISKLLPFSLADKRDLGQAAKGMLQLLPQRHAMDGFFLAKFYRKEV